MSNAALLLASMRSGSRGAHGTGRGGPVASAEFRRIDALPRRKFVSSEEDADAVTTWLSRPGADVRALPLQASAIIECVDNRGGFGMVGVGEGKTLFFTLLCEAMHREHGTQRHLILCPSAAVPNAEDTLANAKAAGWDITADIRIVGFGRLQQSDGADFLESTNADFIGLDEADQFRDLQTARTGRLIDYLRSKRPIYVSATGTAVKTGPMDIAHHLSAALGPTRSPLPDTYPELMQWQAALAAKTFGPPGVLYRWRQGNEKVVAAWGRRLRETPGVFHSDGVPTDVPLTVRTLHVDLPIVNKVIQKIVTEFKAGEVDLPDHLAQTQAINAAAHGHYQRIEFPAHITGYEKAQWYKARSTWNEFVRSMALRKHMDTEGLVRQAVHKGECRDRQDEGRRALEEWLYWQNYAKPFSVTEWFAYDEVAGFCADWLDKVDADTDGPGIVWVSTVEAGTRIAAGLDLPFFGAGCERQIVAHRGHCFASVAAHGVGRNLQQFARALVLSAGADGVRWQQHIGRHHRRGQKRRVVFDISAPNAVFSDRLRRAFDHAKWIAEQTNETQRLTLAKKETETWQPL